jgi:pyruvoyl-dependent arginine decarboxylase (PvlArgDC)
MNINQDIFYEGVITQQQKEALYTADTNLVSLAIGLHRASGKDLSIGYLSNHADTNEPYKAVMFTKEGFPAMQIGRKSDVYFIKNQYIHLLERAKDKYAITSKKADRLVREMKGKRLTNVIAAAKDGYMGRYIHNTYNFYQNSLGFEIKYERRLTGHSEFELLKVLLGNKSTADVSDDIRNGWASEYAKFKEQENKINACKTELAEVFSKETWAVYSSVAGVIVGTVKCAAHEGRFTEVLPFKLYKSVHDIQDEALREDLVTTLTMCRTNREQGTKSNELSYHSSDPDKFFPTGDHVFVDSQSVAYTSLGGTGIFSGQIFMAAR